MDEDRKTSKQIESASPFLQQKQDEVVEKKKSFWTLCKDKRYRGKLFYSFCLACSLFCVWFQETQPGATFLDLKLLTRTSFEEASRFFTIHTVGYMMGSVLGAFLPRKISPDIVISIGLLGMGASVITTPFCSSYSLMMVNRWVNGIFPGIAESVIYAEQMRVWQDEGKSVTQLVMLLSSVSLFLAPIASEPFLAPKGSAAASGSDDPKRRFSNASYDVVSPGLGFGASLSNLTTFTVDESLEVSTTSSPSGNFRDTTELDVGIAFPSTDRLFYAFLISACISIVTAIFFVPFSHLSGQRSRNIVTESEVTVGKEAKAKTKYRTIPKSLEMGLTLGFCLFVMFLSTVGISFSSFLMTFFVRKFDHITKSDGAYILTLFFCCGSVTRVVLIFLADRVVARRLLCFFVILISLSFISFNIAAIFDQTIVLIVLTGIMNIGLAPALPLILSWCQAEYLHFTNFLSSCLTFSTALGVLSNPLLLSYLMDSKTNMWFCFLHTLEALIGTLIFVILIVFNTSHVNKRYGPLIVSTAEANEEKAENIDMAIHLKDERVRV